MFVLKKYLPVSFIQLFSLLIYGQKFGRYVDRLMEEEYDLSDLKILAALPEGDATREEFFRDVLGVTDRVGAAMKWRYALGSLR